MKKVLTILLAFALLLSLTACGDSGGQPSNSPTQEPTKSQETETASQTPETEQPNETEHPVANGVGDLGDYHVEIKGAVLGKDYEGNPIIVITYAWTNNSDETKSPMWTMSEKAFQDGVQLDRPIIVDGDIYDAGAAMKEARPGTTIEAQCAFIMTSESIVEFEITELISFSSDMVSMNFDPTTL